MVGKVGNNAEKLLDGSLIYVVRLDGNLTTPAQAKAEGDGFTVADAGNTFILGGSGGFPEYVSYTSHWLGDSVQDAKIDWNGLEYHAGFGGGSAGYAQARLPALSESSQKEIHTQEIAIQANAGAFVELRFKVRN